MVKSSSTSGSKICRLIRHVTQPPATCGSRTSASDSIAMTKVFPVCPGGREQPAKGDMPRSAVRQNTDSRTGMPRNGIRVRYVIRESSGSGEAAPGLTTPRRVAEGNIKRSELQPTLVRAPAEYVIRRIYGQYYWPTTSYAIDLTS